jgi:hypothetical protein
MLQNLSNILTEDLYVGNLPVPGNSVREGETRGKPGSDVSALQGLDRVLNLNEGGAANLLGVLGEMSRENMDGFLRSLTDLLKHGVVGYEYREVNGSPTKVFVDVAIGSDLHRAPLVQDGRLDTLI